MARRKEKPEDLEGMVGSVDPIDIRVRLSNAGIDCLDDISSNSIHSNKKLLKDVGIRRKGENVKPEVMKYRLTALGIFSFKIRDHKKKVKDKIIDRILNMRGNFSTSYFDQDLDEEVYKSNVEDVLRKMKKWKRTKDMKYLEDGIGIENLDDITGGNALSNRGFWNSISIKIKGKTHSVDDIRKRLVELDLFSARIRDYKGKRRAKILNKILRKQSGSSYYFSNSLEPEIWKDNVGLVFKEIKKMERIKHLNDVDSGIANRYGNFWSSLNIKVQRESLGEKDVKMILTELKLLSPRISDYKQRTQQSIIKSILKKKSGTSLSPYLNVEIGEEIWRDNVIRVSKEIIKREGIKHLDAINAGITTKYPGYFSDIGVDRDKKHCTVDGIKKKVVELGLFNTKIEDYEDGVKQKIVNKILNQMGMFHSFYLSKYITKNDLISNISVILNELKKTKGIEYLEDIKSDSNYEDNIIIKHAGFWNSIGVRGKRKNDVHTTLIHLGYFNDEAEEKYAYAREEGSVVELMKKLDYMLFDYKDIFYDGRKVDIDSFKMLKALNEEAQKLSAKQRPRNSLDLIEYYHKEYAHGKA